MAAGRIAMGDGDWLGVGANGWLLWHRPDFPRVRLRADVRGGEAILTKYLLEALYAESVTEETDKVVASMLRLVPVGKIEEIINQQDMLPVIQESFEQPERFIDIDPTKGVTASWAFLAMEQQLPLLAPEVPAAPRPASKKDKGDAFYSGIAQEFQLLRRTTKKPAQEVAARHGVETTTVHRWMKEARRRGLAAPARRRDATVWAPPDEPVRPPEASDTGSA